MSDNYNHGFEVGDDLAEQAGKQAGNFAKKQGRKIGRKVSKKAKQAVGKMVKQAVKAIGKASLILLKILLPYLLILLAIIFIFFSIYYVVFETRGSEQNYSIRMEAENEEKIGYFLSEDLSAQNRAILNFYNYHSNKSFYQIIGDDNTKLEQTEGEDMVVDYYNREKQFYLNPNLLFALDELIYRGNIKYPEQFTKPVNYDPDTLTLEPLTDEDDMVIAMSDEWEDGEKTGNQVPGVWDYGLGSIFKYEEADRKIMLEGSYVKMDVWDESLNKVVTIDITPEEFSIELEKEKIWLITKAITFIGEFEWEFEESKQELRPLIDGSSADEKTEYVRIQYDTYDEYEEVNVYDWVEVENEDGEIEKEYQIVGTELKFVQSHPLYKYRQGAVYEYAPHPIEEIFIEQGDKYFKDYVYNFKTYIPESVINEFNFQNRVGQLLNTHLDVGSKANAFNDSYTRSMAYEELAIKYGEKYGVDPYMIIAQMAQESGGNKNINNGGLMQIDPNSDGTWDKTITATTTTGEEVTLTITKEQRKDPEIAIEWATMLMANLLDKYDGDYLKALQGYNFGSGTMNWIKENYPEAWQTVEWMNYRVDAQVNYLFPRGLKGDATYVENVLAYYNGDVGYEELEEHDELTLWEGFINFIFPEYEEKEIHNEFTHRVSASEAENILKLATTMEYQILFSDDNLNKLMFWDEGFATAFKNQNLTLTAMNLMIPGLSTYETPLKISNPVITKSYGNIKNPSTGEIEFHGGIEIAVPEGTPVYSISDGTVEIVENGGSGTSLGKYVKVNHTDGTTAVYGHLESINVSEGDYVYAGDVIGATGSSGDSTGGNLYLEFYVNGGRVDPYYIVVKPEIYMGELTPLLEYALSLRGAPYIWGSEGPDDWDGDGETSIGYDCSGFVCAVFYKNGINLGRQTVESLWNSSKGVRVSITNLQPGDFLFYDTVGPLTHIGMYLGDGKFIHASSSRGVVVDTFQGYWRDVFHGAKRFTK